MKEKDELLSASFVLSKLPPQLHLYIGFRRVPYALQSRANGRAVEIVGGGGLGH